MDSNLFGNVEGCLGVALDNLDPTEDDTATCECLDLFFRCFIYEFVDYYHYLGSNYINVDVCPRVISFSKF